MGLKDDLLWRYDPSDVEQAYNVAESSLALAVHALRVMQYTDNSKRWLHSKERRELTALWVATLHYIDSLGTYDKKLVGASDAEVREFIDNFLKEHEVQPVQE